MPTDDSQTDTIDWSLTTWEGARHEQMRRWKRMPLADMILALKEMQVLAGKLAQSSGSGAGAGVTLAKDDCARASQCSNDRCVLARPKVTQGRCAPCCGKINSIDAVLDGYWKPMQRPSCRPSRRLTSHARAASSTRGDSKVMKALRDAPAWQRMSSAEAYRSAVSSPRVIALTASTADKLGRSVSFGCGVAELALTVSPGPPISAGEVTSLRLPRASAAVKSDWKCP